MFRLLGKKRDKDGTRHEQEVTYMNHFNMCQELHFIQELHSERGLRGLPLRRTVHADGVHQGLLDRVRRRIKVVVQVGAPALERRRWGCRLQSSLGEQSTRIKVDEIKQAKQGDGAKSWPYIPSLPHSQRDYQ